MTISDHVSTEPKALQFKAGLVPLLCLEIHQHNLDHLEQQLIEKTGGSPKMFNDSPVILGLDSLPKETDCLDIQGLVDLCLRYGIRPIAARCKNDQLAIQLREAGIAQIAPASQKTAAKRTTSATLPDTRMVNKPTNGACYKVVNTPIRSGQQIIAPEGDLIITAPVSAGAELLAHGNIHIYGPLRGRALAGINGDSKAQIFCHSFDAELVAIAGHYCNESDAKYHKKAVRISLRGDQLAIDSLC